MKTIANEYAEIVERLQNMHSSIIEYKGESFLISMGYYEVVNVESEGSKFSADVRIYAKKYLFKESEPNLKLHKITKRGLNNLVKYKYNELMARRKAVPMVQKKKDNEIKEGLRLMNKLAKLLNTEVIEVKSGDKTEYKLKEPLPEFPILKNVPEFTIDANLNSYGVQDLYDLVDLIEYLQNRKKIK